MKSWPVPRYQPLPGEPAELKLYDSADQRVKKVAVTGDTATMYVCGITPYDSTHLGHAATYLTFDLIYRQLLDAGKQVHYVQNITDVDDPLFERAERDGVDWRELGTSQIDLFRSDMEILGVFPPQDYIGAIESIDEVIDMVSKLLDNGAAYVVDDPEFPDIYASIEATEHFGYESNYSREQMEIFFAERGGDPERPGKRDPLDALLWRANRAGEPAWESPFGPGRPGWHIECSAIATNRLGTSFDIQGGGSDLLFPHHEFSAAHAEAAHGVERMAGHYVHTGMIGLDGAKMSKSLGNLVFVHKLVEQGVDPSAIRLGVYSAHYRTDRDWSDAVVAAATERLHTWREAVQRGRAAGGDTAAVEAAGEDRALADAAATVAEVRARLADDLDAPAAIAAVDAWAARVLAEGSSAAGSNLVAHAMDSLFGVQL